MSRRTPLYDRHVALHGSMVDFAGFCMPVRYSGIRDEHMAVRQRAGLFDISHMGEVRIRGEGALGSLQRLCANNVGRLRAGQALYGVMCNADGGIVDDIIVYRDGDNDFMVVINAACHDKDIAWMRQNLEPNTELCDESDEWSLLAVQGPGAVDVVTRLVDTDVSVLHPFHCVMGHISNSAVRVSRTGYTGEDGFELYVSNDSAARVWDAVLDAGSTVSLLPCGLGARDTLRLEAGLRLYGQDMDESTDPFSAALGWTVKLDKGVDCIGSTALRQLDPQHPPRRFVGLAFVGRDIPRHGQTVSSLGEAVGMVLSGTYSFSLGHGIATASIAGRVDPNAPLDVDIRGTLVAARIVPLPFYTRPLRSSLRNPHPATAIPQRE